jgi:predicted transcriptional regulator
MPKSKAGEFHSKDKRKLPIFIQSELDDYGLTCPEFRTYARVARRAGGNSKATESVPNMSEAFGVDDSTVRRALKVLCLCGLISKKERPGWTPEYSLEDQDKWRDKSELKAIRESVLHPKKSRLTPMPSAQGAQGTPKHQTEGGVVTTPTRPLAPDIDEGTPMKVLPEGTPSIARPRLKDSDDEIDDKSTRFRIEEMEEPIAFGYDVGDVMTAMFPSLGFRDFYGKWWRSRVAKGGIGRRVGAKATVRQYAADLENFLTLCVENQNKNGNGASKSDYRGPVAKQPNPTRDNCPWCFGSVTLPGNPGSVCKHDGTAMIGGKLVTV